MPPSGPLLDPKVKARLDAAKLEKAARDSSVGGAILAMSRHIPRANE